MKNIKSILIFNVLFWSSISNVYCQSTCLPSGGNLSSSTASMSWSVGQLVVNSYSASNAKINNGIQQSYEYIVETGLTDLSNEDIIQVYPNPTSNWCILKIKNLDADYSYKLFDLKGVLVDCDRINSTTTSINIESYSYALVKIYKGETVIKTIKIIRK